MHRSLTVKKMRTRGMIARRIRRCWIGRFRGGGVRGHRLTRKWSFPVGLLSHCDDLDRSLPFFDAFEAEASDWCWPVSVWVLRFDCFDVLQPRKEYRRPPFSHAGLIAALFIFEHTQKCWFSCQFQWANALRPCGTSLRTRKMGKKKIIRFVCLCPPGALFNGNIQLESDVVNGGTWPLTWAIEPNVDLRSFGRH